MGELNFDPDKALRYAEALENEETLHKFHHRK